MAFKIFNSFRNLAKEFYSGKTFVAFDTETTGLKAEKEFIIEIGAVKFNCDGLIGEPFDILIKPPIELPQFIKDLTHITDEMISCCPSAKEAVPQFLNFIGGKETVLVAHNAQFDLGFVNSELKRFSHPELPNICIDTLNASRWAYPDFIKEQEKGQYKLQSLAKRFGIEAKAAHRANDDARLCMEIFKRIISDTMDRQKNFSMNKIKKNLIQAELF
ncbi:3'-5' exonuclease [uncultured Treponema sp.]|uniref:3'-5' exonuclease n=1 Tax=uncultured Treponema sp. TaxID=162155 RepID=UPI0025E3D712|nr:3'-5' exonuclease [uncultured Treponema sp.]